MGRRPLPCKGGMSIEGRRFRWTDGEFKVYFEFVLSKRFILDLLLFVLSAVNANSARFFGRTLLLFNSRIFPILTAF